MKICRDWLFGGNALEVGGVTAKASGRKRYPLTSCAALADSLRSRPQSY